MLPFANILGEHMRIFLKSSSQPLKCDRKKGFLQVFYSDLQGLEAEGTVAPPGIP